MVLVNEPMELALGEKGVHKVEAREIPKVRLADLEGVDEPEVLGVPVAVLVGAESVGDALDRVYDGASKVVGRV